MIKKASLLCCMILALPFQSIVGITENEINQHALLQPKINNNQALLDALFAELKASLSGLSYTLQSMALVINNNQIRAIDKNEATPILLEMQQLVASIQQMTIATVTPQTLARLLNLTGAMLIFLQEAMDNNFKNVEFNPDTVITRSTTQDIKPEQLQEQLKSIQLSINDLQKQSSTLGLRFYNRWFRSLESLNKKLKLTKIAGYTALAAATATVIIYFTPKSWWIERGIDHPFFIKVKDTLGDSVDPNYGVEHHDTDDNRPLGILTGVEFFLGDKGIGLLDPKIGAIVGGYMFKDQLKALGSASIKKVNKWYKKAFAWLRGGPVEHALGEYEVVSKATFDDVIGNEEIKQQLRPVIEYILDHKNWDQSGTPPQTGFLFIGHTRVGKTFMAEAAAGEIKRRSDQQVRMVELNAAELKKEPGITAIFELALDISKESGPLILVIDEIDCGGFKRTGDGADNAALAELLDGLSKINRLKEQKIVVIACTNRPEDIDDALKAPGRFGTHIYFHLPTYQERTIFLQRELSNRTIILSEEFIESLAMKTEGYAFDALSDIITVALQQAKIRQSAVTQQDFEYAYLKVILRVNLTESTLPEDEQHLVAIHQAGIVLARHLLKTKQQVLRATTLSVSPELYEQDELKNKQKLADYRKQYGYVYTLKPIDSASFSMREEKLKEVKVELAGFAAETIINGQASYDYNKHAYNQALEKAEKIVFKNMKPEQLPKQVVQEKRKEAYELIQQGESEIMQLLKEHSDELITLANALHEQKMLDGNQIQSILEQPQDIEEADQEIDLDAFLAEENTEIKN